MTEQVTQLNNVLDAFKIGAICKNYSERKGLCTYDLELEPGTKIRDVEKYLSELSLILRAPTKLTLKIMNEQGLVKCEFIKPHQDTINFFDLFQQCQSDENQGLNCLLGETYAGEPLQINLTTTPHLLVAGCTGSGKSTLLHTIIANLLLRSDNTKLVLMDPKNIEFYPYQELIDVVGSDRLDITYDYDACLDKLNSLCQEMDERYALIRMAKAPLSSFPYTVLMIDEFADLIQQDQNKEFQSLLSKLAHKSRSAGIHIVLSTQRPSVDIIDGTIKANFPTRIACKVSSKIDSRVILDVNGAQSLMGRGDALLKSNQGNLQRFQVAYCSADETIKQFRSSK